MDCTYGGRRGYEARSSHGHVPLATQSSRQLYIHAIGRASSILHFLSITPLPFLGVEEARDSLYHCPSEMSVLDELSIAFKIN